VRLSLEEEDIRAIARAVADELRAGTEPEMVDQHASPLGPRRHVAAIRSGKLAGLQIGRRWLARREDVAAYVGDMKPAKNAKPRTAEEELAAELGIDVQEARH
jgi:hypothetical protein